MIVTIIALCMLVIGITLYTFGNIANLTEEKTKFDIFCEHEVINMVILFIGTIATIFCLMPIICAHTNVNAQIEERQIKYETLFYGIEKMESSETAVDGVLLQDVAKWNRQVSQDYRLYKNPWCNWFYCDEVVESQQLIKLP